MAQIMIRCDDSVAQLIKQIARLESRSVNRQLIHMIQAHPLAEKAAAVPLPEKKEKEEKTTAVSDGKWRLPDEWFANRETPTRQDP